MKIELTEAEKQEFVDAVKQATDDELVECTVDVLRIESECRAAVGLGEDDYCPVFINPLIGFVSQVLIREIELRKHDYVEQGPTVATEYRA